MAMTILNGRLMFLRWIAVGDDFHLTRTNCESAPFGPLKLPSEYRYQVSRVVPHLKEAMALAPRDFTRRMRSLRSSADSVSRLACSVIGVT